MSGDVADWTPRPDEFAVLESQIRCAPRLFALCELERDDTEGEVAGEVFAWGLSFDDRAEVLALDGRNRGSFRSADRAARFFSRCADVRLVWP
ncbi:hypothetical protein HUO13_13715 [Saccharopolyspora erythraea]|uniref:hypothetical protein n=1 Tax=Saccharopolyspora erythraea TaxID=1836 RepID=UPI001BAA6C4A|nr:hypothetical protein [Saccharopolyspora erythraea]QUH01732.1 hypothetical protein HUO13_13715 [Saccharopolyspora erythraea]